jgi:hypothetical protein
MTNNDRNDRKRNLREIGKSLGRLSPSPVPPGLRQRVMDRALAARKSAALTPGMRILAVVCSVTIVAVLVIDPLVGRHEAARLAALLDGRSAFPAASPETELAEVLGGQDIETERMVRLQLAAAAAARKEQEHHVTEAWRRLKGWLADETSEDLI